MFAVQADGADVRPSRAWPTAASAPAAGRVPGHQGLQCGFCTPGLLITACELLERNPQPTSRRSAPRCRATSAAARATSTSSTRSRRGRQQQWPLRPARGSARHQAPRGPGAAARSSATFTNDLRCPGMLHAAVLRSPHPHARSSRSTATARGRSTACIAVLTGAELAEVIGPLPRFCAEEVVEHAVAVEKVRYVGEAVAIVVAESRYVAEDALALVEVDYALLSRSWTRSPARRAERAAGAREPRHERRLREHVHVRRRRRRLRRAAHVVRRALRWPRAAASPMEPTARSAVRPRRPGGWTCTRTPTCSTSPPGSSPPRSGWRPS